jgi:hypothetical protein
VSGTVLTNQSYVTISWIWLSVLLGQIVLSTVFLSAIIIWTRMEKLQIIKTSSLATFVALDADARSYLGSMGDFDSLGSRADQFDVRLERGLSGSGAWLSQSKYGPAPSPRWAGGMAEVRRRRYAREVEERTPRPKEENNKGGLWII